MNRKVVFALSGLLAVAVAGPLSARTPDQDGPATQLPEVQADRYRAPTAETFLVERAELSPDGTRVAYVAALANSRKLRVQSLDGTLSRTADLGGADPYDLVWAGDDHVILTLARQSIVDMAEDNALFTAVAFNATSNSWENLLFNTTDMERTGGRTATRLEGFPPVWPIIFERPIVRRIDGALNVFVDTITLDGSCRYDLYSVDLDTGASRLAEQGTTQVQAFVVGEEGQPLALMQEGRIRVSLGVGWRTLAFEPRNAPLELLGLGQTPGSVLVRVGTGDAATLVEVSGRAGETRRPLSVEGLAGAEPLYDDQTGRLLGFESQAPTGAMTYRFLEPKLAQAWPGVIAAFEGETVSLASWSADFTRLLVYAEKDGAPAYHLIDLTAGTATLLAPSYPPRSSSRLDRTGSQAPAGIRRAAAARIADPRMLCVPGAAERVY